MSFRFQFRRGTTAERNATNPILAAGEPAVVLDSGQPAELVLGDGVTAMADLRAAVWDDDARLALADTATQPGDLGTAAVADVGDFATAAQGALADGATQRDDLMQRLVANDLIAGPAAAPLTTPTYDGSGQAVHPDVIYRPDGWGADGNSKAWRYWMSMTPYPNGDDSTENPSILVSDDGDTWQVPPGLTNPIAAPGAGFWPDPDLTLVGDRLYCVWAGHRVSWSDDGITWTAPLVLASYVTPEISPAVLYEDGAYRMWSVQKLDGGVTNKILHRTAPSLESATGWGAFIDCTLVNEPIRREPWHIDVVKVADQYLAAISCCTRDTSGAATVLYMATSLDGLEWTFADDPILTARPGQWDGTHIYRSSLLVATGHAGSVADIWYSARSEAGAWRIGRTRVAWRDSAIAQRAPLATIARHEDTVEARGTDRNRHTNPTLLVANGVRPEGHTNNLIGASAHEWHAATESYQFTIPTSASSRNLTLPGLPVTAGQTYTFSFEGTTDLGGRRIEARIQWRNGAAALISTSTNSDLSFPSADVFERITVSGVAPVGAVTADLGYQTEASPTDTTVVRYKWRRAQFEAGALTDWTPGPAVRQIAATGQTANLAEWWGPVTTNGQILRAAITKDGAFRLAKYTTALRPAAATAGEGAVIYDDTLNVPIFSDGTNWKNFAGTVV